MEHQPNQRKISSKTSETLQNFRKNKEDLSKAKKTNQQVPAVEGVEEIIYNTNPRKRAFYIQKTLQNPRKTHGKP